jgi:hypothetical protein
MFGSRRTGLQSGPAKNRIMPIGKRMPVSQDVEQQHEWILG